MPRRTSSVAGFTGGNDTPAGRKAGELVDAPGQLREELLQEGIPELARKVLPLKNGAGQMELGRGQNALDELRWTQQYEPDLLVALHALVEGQRAQISHEQLAAIRKRNFLMRSGGVRRDIQAVMIAGYRETAGRPFVDEPFDLSDPEHDASFQRFNKLLSEHLAKFENKIPLRIAEFKALAKKLDNDDGPSR